MEKNEPLIHVLGRRIGARLKELRIARGLTCDELAMLIGSHRPIVSRTEQGHHVPTLEVIYATAAALGVHPVRDVLYVLDDLPKEAFKVHVPETLWMR